MIFEMKQLVSTAPIVEVVKEGSSTLSKAYALYERLGFK
jgi:hypothetical protein|tara:strand:+ start:1422 stop:1538 length:117 start_codon:yes stop_codon:yes gene_type:complete